MSTASGNMTDIVDPPRSLTAGFSLPFFCINAVWLTVLVLGPCVVCGAKNRNKETIRVSIVLTAISCWLFWFVTYLAQMNPLIGPELKPEEAMNVARHWGSVANYTQGHH